VKPKQTNTILVGDNVAISDRDEFMLHHLTLVFEIKDPNDQVVPFAVSEANIK